MLHTDLNSFLPANEALRLEKLRDYEILDTHSEDNFDKLALMASQLFQVPAAFITFVDAERVFLKSNLSPFPENEIPRESSLSSLVILNNESIVIEDTSEVEAFEGCDFVAIDGGMRFFAAVPLKSPEGYNVGAFCVADSKPGSATQTQIDMLKTLSKIVIDKLENRLRYRKAIENHIDLMNIALHEIKNPLASIKLANEIIQKSPPSAERMTEMIKASVIRIQAKLSELLRQTQAEESEKTLSIEEVHLSDIFTRLINNFDLLAERKNQRIVLECEEGLPSIFADRIKISDVMHNLLSNAIKYSFYGSTIKITATKDENNHVRIAVKDEGQGLNTDDVTKLFTKFAKLSSKPTGRETSSGLGLSITKSIVEMHNGSIHAQSDGKNKGTTFVVLLPIEHKTVLEEADFNA
jgi:signal transduction histidine kinase